jgi:hypothetical protein
MVAALSKSKESEAQSPAPTSISPKGFYVLLAEARPPALTGDRQLASEALRLLMRLDWNLREARAQWNQDWFRRVMHARSKAVSRVRRRWQKVKPTPAIPLGSLTRRYHANLAMYLYHPSE